MRILKTRMHDRNTPAAGELSPTTDPPLFVVACQAWFYEQIGGSFKIATELAEHLAASGFRVCYVCGTQERDPKNPTLDRGVELWRYPLPRSRSPHPANLMAHVWKTRGIVKKLQQSSPIRCVNGHTPLQHLGASLAVGRSVRQIYSVHSPFDDELRSHWQDNSMGILRRLAIRLASVIDRANCRRADVVQCDSHYTAKVLRERKRSEVDSKIKVVPGWADTERFCAAENTPSARTSLGPEWQTPHPVFFSVRRLEPRMGLDSLVDAAEMLRDHGRRFRVIIGGSGSAEESLRNRIQRKNLQDCVFLPGRIADSDLSLCYAAADCFVLPTRALECFGLIVLEAFAAGTPVIASRVGAIPEIANRQGDQWLFEPGDAGQLAERMGRFLDGEIRSSVNLRAIAEEYDRSRVLERWVAECLT